MANLLPHRPLKGRGLDQPFDLILQGVGQLEALAVKPFDPIVFHGIVAGADHHRRVRLV